MDLLREAREMEETIETFSNEITTLRQNIDRINGII